MKNETDFYSCIFSSIVEESKNIYNLYLTEYFEWLPNLPELYRIRIYILSLGPFKLANLPDKLQNNYHFCRVVVRVKVQGGGGENIHILLYIKIT